MKWPARLFWAGGLWYELGMNRPQTFRIGSVSFLNAKPLVYGLENQAGIELCLDVPSRLLEGLSGGRFDVALLPVIDYQRMEGLCLVKAAGIGCDGPTLTVRIFSTRPVKEIRTLACDTDSHTSVALARIILAEKFGITPKFVDLLREDPAPVDAMLLIGDKVVCQEPAGFDHQVDLGAAWKELTGLPFVFAVWTARKGADLGSLPARLEQAKREGLAHVDEIISRYGVPRGWPAGLALQYLKVYLQFDIGEPHLQAIRRFYELAAKHALIASPPRQVEIYPG
jgi:chorismate dehydratase